jgi:hypothetical protein
MDNSLETLELDTAIADDGLAHGEDDGAEGVPALALGYILDTPNERQVAKHVVKLREDQSAAISRDRATWTRNRWWREGRRWVKLEKKQDNNLWRAVQPSGMANAPPVPNKTDRLCTRLINVMLVDPPAPECTPQGDSNEARDSAEFATRYLLEKGSADDLNMRGHVRSAGSKAQTFASAFGWVRMDPGGAGHRPRPYLAHPQATTPADALMNPTTGLPATEDELQERYLRPDGVLTDDPSEAELQWLPAPKIRLLTGLQLRFLPATSRSLQEADGCHITDFTTLGDLKRLFPKRFARLSKEELAALCRWKPDHVEDILPPYTEEPDDCKDGEEYTDAQTVYVTTVYYGLCSQYPKGCYAVIGGDSLVLHKQTWTAHMAVAPNPDGTPKPDQEKVMRKPVAQCRCLDDDTTDNGMGQGIVEKLGPADEIAASALGFELEHMFRSANPHTFLPIGSVVQPKQMRIRDGSAILVNPQGKPETEQVPPLSATVPLLRAEMQHDQDDATGLQQTAQGVEGSTVKSGIHAQTIVQEALKAVSNMKDNLGDYYVTLNAIILEQSRAYCTAASLLSYTGEDGAYKEKEWSRVDFGTTEKVAIKKGTYTMHTLVAKQEMANNALQLKTIDVDEYNEMMAGGVSPIMGRQDNPDLLRVRTQLEKWKDGPPPGWMETYQAQLAAAQQQYQVGVGRFQEGQRQAQGMVSLGIQPDPATMPPQPAPFTPPPLPPGVFKRLPIDLEPMAAKIRHRQMHREMAGSKFEAMPEPWQQSFIAEYTEMANAAGIMTVPQVQKAKADAEAQLPPALPKGVSIAMKGDESNVGAEEQAALAGFQGGGARAPSGAVPAPSAAASASAAAPAGGYPWESTQASPALQPS